MSTKKPNPDRHKRSKLVRIRLALHEALQRLAAKNSTDLTEEANRLIRIGLQSEGMWPPPPPAQS
jgi:hypothetical protein